MRDKVLNFFSFSRVKMLLGLLITFLIFIFIKTNALLLFCCLITWWLTLAPLKKEGAIFYLIACLIFIPQDINAVANGIFSFSNSDILGLPVWQFFVWGYWPLFTLKFYDINDVPAVEKKSFALLTLFCLCFAFSLDQEQILISSTVAIILLLTFHHSKIDLLFFIHMAIIGSVVEIIGIKFGVWSYPENSYPIWSINMWGGIGIFLSRIGRPLYYFLKTGELNPLSKYKFCCF